MLAAQAALPSSCKKINASPKARFPLPALDGAWKTF
jgi:hypothetical protein